MFEPQVFEDSRGFFMETYNKARFDEETGRAVDFVQDNHSKSRKGVLRGLHYQLPPDGQGKLVRVIAGEIFDVAVDIRRSSPSFGKAVGVVLSAENRKQFWIPEGFAHGFLVLSDSAEIIYKASAYYSPTHERSILWSDPTIAINWPGGPKPILSAKDEAAPLLADAEVFEELTLG